MSLLIILLMMVLLSVTLLIGILVLFYLVVWSTWQAYCLTDYFLSKDKKSLLVRGDQLDHEVKRRFGWMLNCSCLFSGLTYVILMDQVSRHVYRRDSQMISRCSRKLMNYLDCCETVELKPKEHAMLSLAIRHLCRILSLEENGSENHQKISLLLDQTIYRLRNKLEYYEKFVVGHGSELEAELQFAREINSNNLKIYRLHHYTGPDYQIWTHPIDYNQLTHQWLLEILDTEIAQYFTKQVRLLVEEDERHQGEVLIHIYLMISGGIDSMTMARLALALILSGQLSSNYKFHGLHINWKKRNEADQEAAELERFFQHFNGIDFDFTVIESTIDPNDPQWDRKSTDFRFEIMRNRSSQHEKERRVECVFCMGHVVTDLIENLICNATLEGNSTGKQTYLDLFGMRELMKVNQVWLFRPLLLHPKPEDKYGTPFLRDNAKNLDIKRRVVRRAITNHPFDLSRIRQVYSEFEEIMKRYDDQIKIRREELDCTIGTRKISGWYFIIDFDPKWTLTEWRQVLSSVMRRLSYPNVKKGSIQELIKALVTRQKNQLYLIMSKPFIGKHGFIVMKQNNTLAIPIEI